MEDKPLKGEYHFGDASHSKKLMITTSKEEESLIREALERVRVKK